MIKGVGLLVVGTIFGGVVGAAAGLIAGLALHEVILDEAFEKYKAESQRKAREHLQRSNIFNQPRN